MHCVALMKLQRLGKDKVRKKAERDAGICENPQKVFLFLVKEVSDMWKLNHMIILFCR